MVSESGLDFKGHRSDPRRAGDCLVVVAGRGFDMNPTCEVLYKPTTYPKPYVAALTSVSADSSICQGPNLARRIVISPYCPLRV